MIFKSGSTAASTSDPAAEGVREPSGDALSSSNFAAEPTRPASTGEIQVEGNKLLYHLDRLEPFLRGDHVFPLYVEFSPVGSCNHRCSFCAYDYIGYPNRRLDTERTCQVLVEMGQLGVKSVLWAGEGEPLLHPDLGRFVRVAKESGIDGGVFSNASALTERRAHELLPHLTFLRCSFNAGDRETYEKVHQADHFDRVLENLGRAVALREREGWRVTLGMQIVMLPENQGGVVELARIASELGVDYLALKPFVQHPEQNNRDWSESFRVDEIEDVATAAEAYSRDDFRVLVRRASFESYQHRSYRHCHALPFFAFILSDGSVYTCGPYYGDPEHVYGNILEQDFGEIWNGERARAIHRHAACELDVGKCMPNCRPDSVNRLLATLKQAPQHVNFV